MGVLSMVASAARAAGRWLLDKIGRIHRRHVAALHGSETYRKTVRAVVTSGTTVAAAFISAELSGLVLALGLMYVAYYGAQGPEETGDATW